MPQINSGKSPPWVSGEIVTAAGLNGMIDAATLDPSAVTAQSDFPTLTGDEYALIVDPVSGQLKKTQLKNSLLAGNAIETNYIAGHNAGNTTLSLVAGSDFYLSCGGLGGLTNTGIEITGTGVPVKIKSVFASGGSASAGGLMFESAGYGMDFSSTGNGTVRFAQRTLFNTTGAIKLPVGTTAQRPATPVAGDTRFNSTTSKLEFYNGTAWVSSITSSSGTSTYLLYEIYQENIGASGFVSTAFTKPVGELWEFEVIFNYISTINSSSQYAYSETFTVSVILDGSTKWYASQPSRSGVITSYLVTAKWTEDSSTSYTSKTVSITGQSGSFGYSAPTTSGTTSMIIKKYKVLS